LEREGDVPIELSTGTGAVDLNARGDDASLSVSQDSAKGMILRKIISVAADESEAANA